MSTPFPFLKSTGHTGVPIRIPKVVGQCGFGGRLAQPTRTSTIVPLPSDQALLHASLATGYSHYALLIRYCWLPHDRGCGNPGWGLLTPWSGYTFVNYILITISIPWVLVYFGPDDPKQHLPTTSTNNCPQYIWCYVVYI